MKPVKRIGKEVFFLPAEEGRVRCGEGAFIRLRDGSILMTYTSYEGKDWLDHADACLRSYISRDEGESWQEYGEPIVKQTGASNVMSVSFLRMANGDVGLFYLQKLEREGRVFDEYLLRRSGDEGKTWGEPGVCISGSGYHVVNNDRVVRLKNGRILIPAAFTAPRDKDDYAPGAAGSVAVFYSDDDGESWQRSAVISPLFDNDPNGFQEPGVIELPDGRVWLFMRTGLGFQFEAFSQDGGESFTAPRPNLYFTSPCAPMQVKRVGRYTVAVFNPVPNSKPLEQVGLYWRTWWGRTPFVCAVSEDGGATFSRWYYLEDDPKNDYCYPAVIGGADYFLVGYYHSNGTPICLNSLKITKVGYGELSEK